MRFRGMGEAKSVALIAALELGARRREAEALTRKRISSSYDAFYFMQPLMADLPHEEFWVLFLNRSNRVIKRECISRGGISGTVADIRLIFKMGIEVLASGII